jgi:5'-deoxynucleotidase YfbR-like HD superfamily hydrolase
MTKIMKSKEDRDKLRSLTNDIISKIKAVKQFKAEIKTQKAERAAIKAKYAKPKVIA